MKFRQNIQISGNITTPFFFGYSMDELTSAGGGGALPIVMALMLSSPVGLDLATLQDLMQLSGNLVSGAGSLFFVCICFKFKMKNVFEFSRSS